MTKWGKTHRSLAYQLISKLLAQPQVVTNVNVANVAVDDEAARRKLETALIRIVDARKHMVGDPAVYVDGERLTDAYNYIENPPQSCLPRPEADVAQHATADNASQPVVESETLKSPAVATGNPAPALTPEAARERAMAPSYPQPVSNEPSTTQNYLDWASTRRDPWKNYG